MVDGVVRVCSVPFVTSGAYPEVFYDVITRPHIPQQWNNGSNEIGDINVASRAGVSLRCESAAAGQKKLYIIWDFSKADPKQVTNELIDALIECLQKTSGKHTGLYSKFEGEKNFAAFKERVLAKIPAQTKEQLKKDSGGR
jgi:hypothetical protein